MHWLLDPSTSATRLLDWAEFLLEHDPRYANLVCDIATGKTSMEPSKQRHQSYFTVRQLREKLAEDLRENFGDEAIEDSLRQPNWRGSIHAEKERFACGADRRRW